jgi:hypothetical protein
MAWLRVENSWLGYSVPNKQFYFYHKLEGESLVHQFFPLTKNSLLWRTCSEMKVRSISILPRRSEKTNLLRDAPSSM